MSVIGKAVEEYDKYARNWSNDASYYKKADLYVWMESQIQDYKNIIEIGCGTGASTEILLGNGHMVVAIEENPSCLEATYLKLKNRYRVQKIKRSKLVDHGPRFGIKYSEIPTLKTDLDLLLIDGNISLDDPYLLGFLAKRNVDAVVCWLMGTDGYTRCHTVDEQNTGVFSPPEYRTFVHKRIYHLAADWLSEKGILHFVDRGLRSMDPAIMQIYLSNHKNLALPSRFVVSDESHLTIDYEPCEIISGVKMISAQLDPSLSEAAAAPALHSIIAHLRQAGA